MQLNSQSGSPLQHRNWCRKSRHASGHLVVVSGIHSLLDNGEDENDHINARSQPTVDGTLLIFLHDEFACVVVLLPFCLIQRDILEEVGAPYLEEHSKDSLEHAKETVTKSQLNLSHC